MLLKFVGSREYIVQMSLYIVIKWEMDSLFFMPGDNKSLDLKYQPVPGPASALASQGRSIFFLASGFVQVF